MKVALLGDKSKDSSVHNMGVAAEAALAAEGFEVTHTHDIATAVKSPVVVNLMMPQTVRLFESKKYGAMRKMVQWYAQTPQNFREDQVLQHLMLGAGGAIMVQSAALERRLNAIMSTYLSPGYRRTLSKALVRQDYGISDAFQLTAANDPTRWVAPFNRVNETFKRFSLHREATTKVAMALALKGVRTTHHFVHATDMGQSEVVGHNPYVMAPQPERAVYEQEAHTYGFFMSTSVEESYGLYYVELLHAGVVGLFLSARWVEDLLPGYPFVFHNFQTLVEGATHLGQNYGQARAELEAWLATRGDQYRFHAFHAKLAEVVRGLAE